MKTLNCRAICAKLIQKIRLIKAPLALLAIIGAIFAVAFVPSEVFAQSFSLDFGQEEGNGSVTGRFANYPVISPLYFNYDDLLHTDHRGFIFFKNRYGHSANAAEYGTRILSHLPYILYYGANLRGRL